MATQMELARQGVVTDEMRIVAEEEGFSPEEIRDRVARGIVVIPRNVKKRFSKVEGIGEGLTTKINVNIGTSPYRMDIEEEREKLKAAISAGTDSVMDLSIGAVLKDVRQMVLEESCVMVGTVPIYQVGYELAHKKRDPIEMTIDDFLRIVEEQAQEGVDFMTIHAGTTKRALELMEQESRVLNIVSRGGSLLAAWMKKHNKENPLYEHYDEILDILHEYDVTISIGDGMRPGATVDATDRAQIEELITIGELTKRAWDKGVQVMVEGPGHIPLHLIETNIRIQKSVCNGAPFYVLGPLPTDVAPGYDHMVGSIGGALAAYFGANFLCYVTPAEHLRLPTVEDVKQGTIASKIAAHIADVAKGIASAVRKEKEMAEARRNLDWDRQIALSIDPLRARMYREQSEIGDDNVCTMCGDFCAVKRMNEIFKELGL